MVWAFPDLKGQAPLRRDPRQPHPRDRTFPDLKGQAPLRPGPRRRRRETARPFPDLKGQAPLRPRAWENGGGTVVALFLTSKVRLHCDFTSPEFPGLGHVLFLTSKVRLHCDMQCPEKISGASRDFS